MDVAYKQRLCSVEIYSLQALFQIPSKEECHKIQKWLQKICFYGDRLKFSDVFLHLFFCIAFQLILVSERLLFPSDLMAALRAYITAVGKLMNI